MPCIADICRYPVKGLNAEHMASVSLRSGLGLRHDRRFAIAHGSMPTAAGAAAGQPRIQFFSLLRDEKLAQLQVTFDPDSGMLTVLRGGKQVVRAKATDPLGRTVIDQFFAGFMGQSGRGTPRLLEAAGHSFSDTHEDGYISLINLASVQDLERVVRRPVHPLRFRGNLYLTDTPAWSEFSWVGCEVAIGAARLRVRQRIDRCGATNVDPDTAERDMNIPRALQQGFGHTDMGIYAEVLHGGDIAAGGAVTVPA